MDAPSSNAAIRELLTTATPNGKDSASMKRARQARRELLDALQADGHSRAEAIIIRQRLIADTRRLKMIARALPGV